MSTTGEMLKRIQLESRGRQLDQITELNLDNCRSNGEIEGLTEEFSSLQKISLINAGITTLTAFPRLLKLRKLELSDNRISGPLQPLSGLSCLTHLNLSGNKIENIEALSPLASLTQLTSLDLFNCDVTKVPQYRDSVYKLIPSLQYLDGFDKEGSEAVDSDDEEGNEENGEPNGNEKEAVDLDDSNEASDEAPENSKAYEEEGESDEGSGDGESEEEESEDEEYGLAYLARDNIEDEVDDEDYEEEGEEEDEDIDEEDEKGGGDAPRGVKRKLEEEEDEEAPV